MWGEYYIDPRTSVQSTKVPREPILITEKWRRKKFSALRADWSPLRASRLGVTNYYTRPWRHPSPGYATGGRDGHSAFRRSLGTGTRLGFIVITHSEGACLTRYNWTFAMKSFSDCCFLGLLALLLFLQPCMAAQLRPDDKNPCIASINGTVYDISKVFDYP